MSITKISRLSGVGQPQADWVRPTDWLTIPDIPAGTQKVYALAAVFSDNVNNFAVLCNGAYTVDWGDGTAPVNYATGVKAEKNLLWANVAAGTLTSEGHRQALVTITPQAGNSLTIVSFDQAPTGFTIPYAVQWREIVMRAPQCSSMLVGSQGNTYNQVRWFTYLGASALTSTSRMFKNCPQLRGVTGTAWTSGSSTFSEWFNGCFALQTVPALDTMAGTNFSTMFNACYALRTVPLFNTSNGTDFSTMFNSCYNLQSAPLFDLSKASTVSTMFQNCYSLTTVPLFNTALCTNFNAMFQNCTRLTSVPLLDTGKGLLFNAMFSGCSSLASIPLFNTALGTNFTQMFFSCVNLKTIPALDVSAGTSFTSMFDSCSTLETLPTLNTAKGTALGSFVWGCVALRNLDIDCSALATAANGNQMVNSSNGRALRTVLLRGLKLVPTSFAVTNFALSATALNDLYTSLGTATGSQTLVVSGNPGSGSSTTSIATAKGWTITGG